MCRMCDANEEHVLADCLDSLLLIYGDPGARRIQVHFLRASEFSDTSLDLT